MVLTLLSMNSSWYDDRRFKISRVLIFYNLVCGYFIYDLQGYGWLNNEVGYASVCALHYDGDKLHLIQDLKVDFVTWSSNICHGTSNHKNSNYVGKCPWMIEAIERGIQNM